MRVTNSLYVLSGSYFPADNNIDTLGDVYGIRTPKGIILVDCGRPVTGPETINETLLYFGIDEPISHVFITHAHHDHCGSAKELQEKGAKIIVGSEDVNYCTNGGVWGMNSPYDTEQGYPAFTPDIIVSDGQKIDINDMSFEIITIPGHTPGSIAIRTEIDGKTAIFTGDALQPDGLFMDSISLGWQGDPGFNRKAVVDSMLKLMKFETDMILPGHGKICFRNGTKLLRLAAQNAFYNFR